MQDERQQSPSTESVCHEENYKRLYDQYGRSLRNYIYYKCGDLEKAEDIMQESFIKLWVSCKKVVMEKVKSFLFTVASRLFIDTTRHHKVELNFIREKPSLINTEDPDHILRETEFGEQLQMAISGLPPGQREVFLMNRIDKMTYQEIAEHLEISVKAVEKRMHLALQNLKEKIQELDRYKI